MQLLRYLSLLSFFTIPVLAATAKSSLPEDRNPKAKTALQNLTMYPQADSGQKRIVIILPGRAREESCKVKVMACPDQKRVSRFVSVINENLLRYNSQQPIVVYVPTDFEVKYRIWSAGKTQVAAKGAAVTVKCLQESRKK